MPTPLPRRRFLGQFATISIVSGLFARRAWAADGDTHPNILGQGDFRYRPIVDWGKTEGRTVNDCHAMVQDKKGRIFLFNTDTSNSMMIYDRSGKLLTTWEKKFPGAHGMTLANENGTEFLFLTDTNSRKIFKCTLDGKVLLELGRPKGGRYVDPKVGYCPTDVAVAPNGEFYVMDGYGSSQVTRYSAKGEEISVFGGNHLPGSDLAHLATCHGGSVDSRSGKSYFNIASRQESSIKRFDLNGKALAKFTFANCFPCFVTQHGKHSFIPQISLNANCAIPPGTAGLISVVDADFKVVSNVGGDAPVYKDGVLQKVTTSANNPFHFPHGVAIDDEESIYVAQWNSGRTFPIKLVRV